MNIFKQDLSLLYLGYHVADMDYAVRNFLLPWHPQFFGRTNELARAIRRQMQNSNSDRRIKIEKEFDEILKGRGIKSKEIMLSPLRNFVINGQKKIYNILKNLNLAEFQELVEIIDNRSKHSDGDVEYWLSLMGFEYVEKDEELVLIHTYKDYFGEKIFSSNFIYDFSIGVLDTTEYDIWDTMTPLYYHDIANWLKDISRPLEINDNLSEY